MAQSVNKKRHISVKKTLLILLVSPFVILGVLILGFIISKPIFDQVDHDKFITLDTQMQKLYQELKTASNGVDDLKYKTVCSKNRTGWMFTGTYNCVVSISIEKDVTSLEAFNSISSRYYPIINNSNLISAKTDLKQELPNDYGKRFVVSGAERSYIEKKTGIECDYSHLLYQGAERLPFISGQYGSELIGGVGNAMFSLRCDETARKSWYREVTDTNLLIPE